MNIRDIVNRDIVNLTNCDQEPIHIPGSIQPHGFLIAFSGKDQSIAFCSGNTVQFLGMEPRQLLGKTIREILGGVVCDSMLAYIHMLTASVTAPLEVTINGNTYQCNIHKSGEVWIAEYEPVATTAPDVNTIFDQTVRFLKYTQEATTLQQLCAKVAEETRTITGYDRVMIYKFDKDYNGEIFAESKRDDLEPFMGLRYPHTDIPVQARQLYITNLLRIITDINYQPVPLYTLDDAPGKNLDLSLSTLRSVSPIHIQYLQNMGVGATLTISLLHEGRLWGLIACHHYSPRYIDHYTRINARLQGHFLTAQINVRELAEEYEQSKDLNTALEALLNMQFPATRSSLKDIVQQPELLALCQASGVAVLLDDEIYKNGKTPPEGDIKRIAAWAAGNSQQSVFSTSKLIEHFPDANTCPMASGVIYYSLSKTNNAAVLWFNPETLEEVYWAGDPEKAIIKNENGLHPRKSFEKWKQVVKCEARPWKTPQLTTAASFAYNLQKHISLVLLTEEETEQRNLARELQETNAELENINWIGTHDLKEPLRKIQMFSSRIIEDEAALPKDTLHNLERMNQSAARMQQLLEDLTSYAKLRHSQKALQHVDLNEVIGKIQLDLTDEITEQGAVIHMQKLPTIKGIPVLVRQLFINIISNALKFSRPGIPPVINITCAQQNVVSPATETPQLFYKIAVSDNGIGFDNKFASKIFKIFTRLHTMQDYEGSGIGLALSKKILQIHGGFIEAESNPDEGATFFLYFPAGDPLPGVN